MSVKVVTGKVRLSYANVWEPKAQSEGQKPKYSVSIIIPKDDKDTIKKINDAIAKAVEEGVAKFGGKKPNIKSPRPIARWQAECRWRGRCPHPPRRA